MSVRSDRSRRASGGRSSAAAPAAITGLFGIVAVLAMFGAGGERAAAAPRGPSDPSGTLLSIAPVEVRVLGQDRWLAGSRASIRIVVSDHDRGQPIPATVRLSIAPKSGNGVRRLLFEGSAGASGTVDASFPVPRSSAGAYAMLVQVSSTSGDDVVEHDVQIQEAADLFLTTDKPLYQPGQTIHLRALALRRPDRRPFKGEEIVFEIEDARGNKVFRKAATTDRFGVVSADFELATEVNAGLYTLRATHPDAVASHIDASAEKKVTVERYLLPKFKVSVTTQRPYYRPGDRVEGTIQAGYFFGKPVARAKATLRLSTITVGVEEIGRVEGETDAAGAWRFEYQLPGAFVGQPLDRGKATVQIEASVVDAADHQEKGRLSLPVSRDLLDVAIVPASRSLVEGVPNTIYVAAAYPDGSPARALVTLQVSTPGSTLRLSTPEAGAATLRTDELGIAAWTFTPRGDRVTVTAAATDDRGNDGRASREIVLGSPAGEGIILSASKALASVGQSLALSVYAAAHGRGAVYLDVVRDRQTVITRSLDLNDGRATTTLPLTPDLAGTIQIHAYRILPDETIVRDTRTVYVSPGDELSVRIRPVRETYRPGEEAIVDVAVSDSGGRPAAAMLGIAGVDESVFALGDLEPGLEKIYFTLERELMEPRYEVHGLEPSAIAGGEPLPIPAPRGIEDRARADRLRDEAARVVFAAAPPQGEFTIRANSYQARFEKAKNAWMEAISKDWESVRQALERYRRRHVNALPAGDEERLVEEGFLPASALRDPWGRSYRIARTRGEDWNFALRSAGPDGRWDTSDDLSVSADRLRRDKDERLVAFGGIGGVLKEGAMRMMAMDAAAPAPPALLQAARAEEPKSKAANEAAGQGAAAPRVRQYFPETLYWNPSVLTDGSGRARLTIPLADSITTWRLAALASDAGGRLGSTQAPLRVFQDFFVDVDLPLWLTRGDEISIPVALYNYLPEPQTVSLTLEPADWFTALPGEGAAARVGGAEVKLAAGEVAGVVLPIRVEKFGRHEIAITARGTRLSDAIRKPVEVLPEGREFRDTVNDRFDGDVVKEITLPAEAIDGASSIFVKIYPGIFSQAVEGLDALLRMPNGCFEQTSSTTYPNVLVLSYLKETKQANPELRMKADQFINAGYQRLVTFEVAEGGFSWFGEAPANQVLTAYGLLEFSDMSKVHDVDPALIERTQRWLAGRQQAAGTWEPDKGGIAEGIINRQSDVLKTTAYVAWALADSGYRGPEVAKALDWIAGEMGRAQDPYTMALVTNAFAAADRRSARAREAAEKLASMKVEREGGAAWDSKESTFTGAREGSADLETTGLAAYALLRTSVQPETARKALTHLIRSKDSFGTWQTTQATVWALRALLLALTAGSAETEATVGVTCNGKEIAELEITPATSDLMRQVDCGASARDGRNEIRLAFHGKGSLLYQIVSRYYIPWEKIPAPPRPILSIDVEYDRINLAKDEVVTERVRVTNNANVAATNVIVDLAVPPGFEMMTEDLQALVGKSISRFEPAARQVILYVDRVEPGKPLSFSVRLKATMMVRAINGESAVYPYYNPEQRSAEKPVRFTAARSRRSGS